MCYNYANSDSWRAVSYACKQVEIKNGRPYCVHGRMSKHRIEKSGKQSWDCPYKKSLANKRDKDRRIQFVIGSGVTRMYLGSILAESEYMIEIQERLNEFRSRQRNELGESIDGWINQTV